ncbi:MAG: hypothetical protein Q4C54_09930 [Clostridia bacterium]|nr:hypothetical protein [Clostridia bacterium]
MAKVRVTRHNGRAGKHGVYTDKHNDRNFDTTHADHIDGSRSCLNVYWDWENGMRTGERSVYEAEDGTILPFCQAEADFYQERYSGYIEGQTERNRKSRHHKRNRTTEDIRHSRKTCPEETVYQFGCNGEGATPEELMAIVMEFQDWFREQYGERVHIIDWAMHLDERTAHIQERHVFDFINQYGEVEPQQEKALEQLGFQLPNPEQKVGRHNNRKMVFDEVNRAKLIEIAKAHGLDIEETVKYGGREYLEKQDYIIFSQREQIEEQTAIIAEQQKTIASQQETIAAKDAALAEKEAELDVKLFKLEDVDMLIDQVTTECYDKAVDTICADMTEAANKQVKMSFDQTMDEANAPDSRLSPHIRTPVLQWLGRAREDMFSAMLSMADDMRRRLMSSYSREINKYKIAEAARPAVVEKLKPKLREGKHSKFER